MTGGDVRKVFSCSSARFTSFVHWNLLDFFRSLRKGRPFSPSLLIKRPKATIIPVSFMTSFFPVGRFILRMASTLVGFASMLQWLTMKPRSLPEGTPKTHFSGLSFQR
jgi:hypothetical protein